MMRAMSSAVAGLKAHQDAIDVVGNNIANVNTHSFKSGSVSFRDVMYQNLTSASEGDENAGTAGVNPSQIGYGSAAASVGVDTTNGGKDQTGRPNDCYIDGEGYFVVRDGKNGEKFTRVGTLSFDGDGYLTDGNGGYVLGYDDENSAGDPIHFDDTDLKNVSIEPDGTITAIASDGDAEVIGQICLASFPNASGLEDIGNSYYRQTGNSGSPQYFEPGSGSTGNLVTGSLENSNVDLATEFSNMILYERGYQANTKIISVADEMLQTLVNMK